MVKQFKKSGPSSEEELYLEVQCPVEAKILNMIRLFIASVAREIGFHEEDVHKIEISVDEACANVVCHAYEGKTDTMFGICLKVHVGENYLRISIIDSGVGREGFTQKGVTDLQEYCNQRPHRGLGTYIINKFMDEVEYTFPPQRGTCVSMIKYLHGDATPQSASEYR
ncbi:MAG: ATP-binding protein [bacterium]